MPSSTPAANKADPTPPSKAATSITTPPAKIDVPKQEPKEEPKDEAKDEESIKPDEKPGDGEEEKPGAMMSD